MTCDPKPVFFDVAEARYRSPITGHRSHFLFRRKLARLVLEHHRNVIGDRVAKPARFANELGRGLPVHEWALAQRANEYVEQFPVHRSLLSLFRFSRGFELAHNEIREPRIGYRIHRHRPARLRSEALAFYRILFRHHDRFRPGVCEVGSGKGVMIGKGMGREVEPHSLQLPEKAPWITDSGYGVYAPAAKVLDADTAIGVLQVPERTRLEFHPVALGIEPPDSGQRRPMAVATINDNCIDCSQAGRRLAQRPRRKRPAVSESALAVDHVYGITPSAKIDIRLRAPPENMLNIDRIVPD